MKWALVTAIACIASCSQAPQEDAPSQGRRSSLYPPQWTPGFADEAGRTLPDISYAGYRNGEQPTSSTSESLQLITPSIIADGVTDNTSIIQAAIDGATNGGIISLPAGTIVIAGKINISHSNIVLRGQGMATKLRFTETTEMNNRGHITARGDVSTTNETVLSAAGEYGSRDVYVASSSGFAIGDDVVVGWVITPEFIAEHEMTGIWGPFNDTWCPFFRRRIVAIAPTANGSRLTLDVPLRYPAKLRDQASIRKELGALSGIGIEHLAISDAVSPLVVDTVSRAALVEFIGIKDAWIDDVRSYAPGIDGDADAQLWSRGLVIIDSKRVTISNAHFAFAQHRGDGGNGYLFEIMGSNEVLIRDSSGHRGRHNFIQNWSFGANGLVFLRVHSSESRAISNGLEFGAASEFHHSLAMASAIDDSVLDDGWNASNRGTESSGAGMTATDVVFWNNRGTGILRSYQAGLGYLIGNAMITFALLPSPLPLWSEGSGEEDFVELADQTVEPTSLYEDQLAKRLARGERLWP